jgi:hypothetical protein
VRNIGEVCLDHLLKTFQPQVVNCGGGEEEEEEDDDDKH